MDIEQAETWRDVDPTCIPADLVLDDDPSYDPPTADELITSARALPPVADRVYLLEQIAEAAGPLTAEQHLSVVELWQGCLAWSAQLELDAVAGLAGAQPRVDNERVRLAEAMTALELAAATGVSKEYAQRRISQARLLGSLFSATAARVRAGELSSYRSSRILDELSGCEDETARRIEADVLPTAARVSVAAMVRRIRRALKQLEPQDEAMSEIEDSVRDRRVDIDAVSFPGQVQLSAFLPPVEGQAVAEALDKIAGRFTRADGRTKDQRLADALIGCVLGFADLEAGIPQRPNVQLSVTIDLPTLLHLREHPGELGRYGSLPAPLVRALAGDARWRRFVHDPVDGHLLDNGTVVPACAELDRFVRDRDVYCRFPYSNRSARHADLDHGVPHGAVGGDTSAGNLHALSRSVHRAKTHSGLRIRCLPRGVREWCTPMGRIYRTRPHDYRPIFDDPPAPTTERRTTIAETRATRRRSVTPTRRRSGPRWASAGTAARPVARSRRAGSSAW